MKFLFVFLFLLSALFVPMEVVTAQAGGFVPCSGTDCSSCNLVQMLNSIIIWLLGIIFVIFTVLMTVAGFGLVTSGGNQSALDAAKSKFQNGLIGIIIVLAGFIIVDTLMRGIVGGGSTGAAMGEINGWGPWSSVQCTTQLGTAPAPTPAPGGGEPTATTTSPALCQDDQALMAQYNGSPIGLEAPGLQGMISCYLADPAVSAITDRSQLYTVDRSYPRCSLTNGNTVCGPCSHSNNSAHYGRGSGQGARAVDFNASGASETTLYNALRARQSACGGTLLFENNHTHITM